MTNHTGTEMVPAIFIHDGEELTGYPIPIAEKVLNIREDIAKSWCEHFALTDAKGRRFMYEYELNLFNEPKNAGVRDALNMFCTPLEPSFYNAIFDQLTSTQGLGVTDESQAILTQIKQILQLFPDLGLWPQESSQREVELLKVTEAARVLMISEQKLRSLARSGIINSIKSQGDTGHYRFKREWLREYLQGVS